MANTPSPRPVASMRVLSTVRVSDGAVVGSLSFPADDPSIPNGGLFYGLAFDPIPHNGNYVALCSPGKPTGTVAVVSLASDGTLTKTGTIPATASAVHARRPAGRHCVWRTATLFMSKLLLGRSESQQLSRRPRSRCNRVRDGARLGSYTFTDAAKTNTPTFPYACDRALRWDQSLCREPAGRLRLCPQHHRPLATSSWSRKLTHLSQPSALLLNKAQTLLYVANAESDTVSVADVATDKVRVKGNGLAAPGETSSICPACLLRASRCLPTRRPCTRPSAISMLWASSTRGPIS